MKKASDDAFERLLSSRNSTHESIGKLFILTSIMAEEGAKEADQQGLSLDDISEVEFVLNELASCIFRERYAVDAYWNVINQEKKA